MSAAQANAVQVPFTAAGGSPLRDGYVDRLPDTSRRVFARERYVLEGARPHAELEVRLLVHPFDSTCSNRPLTFATTALRTDSAGNGSAELAVRLEDVPNSARGARHGARWEIRSGDDVLYRTECTPLEVSREGGVG